MGERYEGLRNGSIAKMALLLINLGRSAEKSRARGHGQSDREEVHPTNGRTVVELVNYRRQRLTLCEMCGTYLIVNKARRHAAAHGENPCISAVLICRAQSSIAPARPRLLGQCLDGFEKLSVLSNGSISQTFLRRIDDWVTPLTAPSPWPQARLRACPSFLRVRRLQCDECR